MALGLIDAPRSNPGVVTVPDDPRPYMTRAGLSFPSPASEQPGAPPMQTTGASFRLPSLDTRAAMAWLREHQTAVMIVSGALFLLAVMRSRR